jgi:hypothetical protein
MSTRECGSSAGVKGCSSGKAAAEEGAAEEGAGECAGPGVDAAPVGGICGLTERSDGDVSVVIQGVEY